MDIASFYAEPNPTNIPVFAIAAYRPIYFMVVADSVVTPDQPMYADIYMDGVYYKTLTSYTILTDVGASSPNGVYEFDLQDAYQEYLRTFFDVFPVAPFLQSDDASTFSSVYSTVYFRGSSITAGILTPNPVIPVQATATTPAVAGTGTPCYPFSVVNATILPTAPDTSITIDILANQLERSLIANQLTANLTLSGVRVYPLSNLPLNPYNAAFGRVDLAPTIYTTDNGGFPVAVLQYGISGILNRYTRNLMLVVIYSDLTTSTAYGIPATAASVDNRLMYIPIGLKDLFVLDPALIPLLVNGIYYRVALYDLDAATYEFFSPMFKVGISAIESECLYFQNAYGHMEMVSFVRSSKEHVTSSSDQFVPYVANAVNYGSYINQNQLGHKRYNIRAADELTLTNTFPEALMPWLTELFDSPFILQRMGLMPSGSHYVRAVELIDAPQMVLKSVKDGMRTYEVSVKVRPALDYITIRN